MPSIRKPEFLMKSVKLTATTLRLPSGSTLNIGPFQFNVTSNLDLNTAVSGVGGLDTAVQAGSLYYLYAVVSSSTVYLIASLNSSLPSGFTQARVVGGFTTNASSQIDQVGEYPGNLAVAGSVSAGGGVVSPVSENALINGNFDVWQRATSMASGIFGVKAADRWFSGHNGTVRTFTRGVFTNGQTDVPYNSKYFARHTITVAGSNAAHYCHFYQRILNVALFSGETATLSFWAKADSAKNMAVEFSRGYGTGGSAIEYALIVRTVPLTSSWQKYIYTVNIPSISGKTIASDDSSMNVVFWFDAGTDDGYRTNNLPHQTGVFDISQVKLERGNTATTFTDTDFNKELTRCLPYYEKSCRYEENIQSSGVYAGRVAFYSVAGTIQTPIIRFTTPKIRTSVVTLRSPLDGAVGIRRYTPVETWAYQSLTTETSNAGVGYVNTVVSLPAGEKFDFSYEVDAEF